MKDILVYMGSDNSNVQVNNNNNDTEDTSSKELFAAIQALKEYRDLPKSTESKTDDPEASKKKEADDSKLKALFTQITNKLQAAITSITNADVYNEKGETPLFILARGDLDLKPIEQLLKKKAKTHLACFHTREMRTPLELAAKNMNSQLLRNLLACYTLPDEDELNYFLEFCLEFYRDDEHSAKSNDELITYTASRLLGLNLNNLWYSKKSLTKYFGHIKSWKGSEEGIQYEAWNVSEFLPLRVRVLLEVLIKYKLGDISGKTTYLENKNSVNAIQQEILAEIRTYHIIKNFLAIKDYLLNLSTDWQEKLIQKIANF